MLRIAKRKNTNISTRDKIAEEMLKVCIQTLQDTFKDNLQSGGFSGLYCNYCSLKVKWKSVLINGKSAANKIMIDDLCAIVIFYARPFVKLNQLVNFIYIQNIACFQ